MCYDYLGHLLGIGAPSATDSTSYNRFLSVHHPMFVVNYAQFVVPDLPSEYYPLIIPYLKKHFTTLNKYSSHCSEALKILGGQ